MGLNHVSPRPFFGRARRGPLSRLRFASSEDPGWSAFKVCARGSVQSRSLGGVPGTSGVDVVVEAGVEVLAASASAMMVVVVVAQQDVRGLQIHVHEDLARHEFSWMSRLAFHRFRKDDPRRIPLPAGGAPACPSPSDPPTPPSAHRASPRSRPRCWRR